MYARLVLFYRSEGFFTSMHHEHEAGAFPLSIEQLITTTKRTPTVKLQEGYIIGQLNRALGANLAPLLLLTEEARATIPGLGKRSLPLVAERMHRHKLKSRDYGEPMRKHLLTLYSRVNQAPIQVLFIYDDAPFARYEPNFAIQTLSELNPTMTVGELTHMSRMDLHLYLRIKEAGLNSREFNCFMRELRERLKNWGLCLRGEERQDSPVDA